MIPLILAALGGGLIVNALSSKNKFNDGGSIPNNYEGKTAEQVWDEWTLEQKNDFLKDHWWAKPDSLLSSDIKDIEKSSYEALPAAVKRELSNHVSHGEYKQGGDIPKNIAKVFVISSKNPLSNQLQKETGDNWNGNDYEEEFTDKYVSAIKHKASGKTFIVFSDNYYSQVDKNVIKDDLDYIVNNKIFGIEGYEFADGRKYADGGVLLDKLHKNIMGTLSFDLKISGMRKPQDFIVYPAGEKTDAILIQSDTRIGRINMTSGKGVMSQSHANGAYGVHLSMDKLIPFELSESQLKELKAKISGTAGESVGSSFVTSDNSFADKFADGGSVDGKKVCIKSKGKGEFKTWDIIDAASPYSYASKVEFDTEEKAKEYAAKKGFIVVEEFEKDSQGNEYEIVVVFKELQKDGGARHWDRYLVNTQSVEQAKEAAAKLWEDTWSDSDLTFVEALTDEEYREKYLKKEKGGKTWIQDAVKNKGALRKTAKKEGLIEGDEKLSMTDIKKLEKMGGKTAKRAYLAETLVKMKKKPTAQHGKMKEVIAHAKATRKEGEAWKMAVKRAWEEVG